MMNLKVGLWQQQTLRLTMTQELSQAIALLQYNAQELSAFLEEKALENPLLQLEASHIKTIDSRFDRVKNSKTKDNKDKQAWIEQIGVKQSDFEAYLKSQLPIHAIEERIFTRLIEHLDENGYLQIGTEQFAAQLHITKEEAEEAIEVLQDMEPAGIGARNLQECLLLQLRRFIPPAELAETIVEQYFELFAAKKWNEIAKHTKASLKEIQGVSDIIQTLNPRPAAIYKEEETVYVTPDVVIEQSDDGISVSVMDGLLPKIIFNKVYYEQLNSGTDKQVNKYLQEKQQDYHWIQRAIEQRKETLLKVTLKIVEKQPEFFTSGPAHLRAMTMKEVAEELDIHESTVSRAVREKYAQTPYGTIELRSFFASNIKSASNEHTSSQQVKKMLEQLVANEDKRKPLSDQALVTLLEKESGVEISRRTIAKYRDQLGIPSSSKRKRYD